MSSYGGMVSKIVDPFNLGDPAATHTPDVPAVAQQYRGLLKAYLGSQPQIYANEAAYQPKYTALGVANRAATAAGGVNTAAGLSPAVLATLRAYDPTVTATLDTLGSQAREQLGYNGALDPATRTALQQNVRGAQAARGLGYGPGDAAAESYYETQTQEQRRAANQGFASSVADETAGYYKDPFSVIAGLEAPVPASSTIVPSGQSDAMLGTAYNAGAAANISTANNLAAANNSY